jgi:hypothetical protein
MFAGKLVLAVKWADTSRGQCGAPFEAASPSEAVPQQVNCRPMIFRMERSSQYAP